MKSKQSKAFFKVALRSLIGWLKQKSIQLFAWSLMLFISSFIIGFLGKICWIILKYAFEII